MPSPRLAVCFVFAALSGALAGACHSAAAAPPGPPATAAPEPLVAAAPSASAGEPPPEPASSVGAAEAIPMPREVHVRHRGPLPTVPPAFAALLDALAPLGQVTLSKTSDDKPALACVGCIPGSRELEVFFAAPPFPGSFTAAGQREIVLQAIGSCGRQGRHWGCLLVVGDGRHGRGVVRVHPAREGAHHLLAHRIEGDRDLLVGVFDGSQQNAIWTDAFAIDFAPQEPVDMDLVTVIGADACGDSGNGFVTSAGSIASVASRDVDKDGVADLVVSGRYGEKLVGDYFRNCNRPQNVAQRAFSYVLLRKPGAFVPEEKTRLAGGDKASLRVLGTKPMRRPGDEPAPSP